METIDRKALGKEIRAARERENIGREKAAEEMNISYRYLQAIENYGRYASSNIIFALCKRFNISIDKYLFPDKNNHKTSLRHQIDDRLDQLQENELLIVDSTIDGIIKSKNQY